MTDVPSVSRSAPTNADVDWSGFDPEAYFQQYYGDVHTDDDELLRRAARFLASAPPHDRPLDMVDIGTGPNLLPFLAALPRAGRLTAIEYAAPNIEWLTRELRGPLVRPQWRHFHEIVRTEAEARGVPMPPLERLGGVARVEHGSIFDLPEARWDAATMFFCAESITARPDEFEAACRSFAGCVRPGGALVAAFLASSSSYEVGASAFPVVRIREADIAATFEPLTHSLDVATIGLVDQEVRSGYFGMILLTGYAR